MALSEESFRFLVQAHAEFHPYKSKGAAVFGTLALHEPEVAAQVKGTTLDPTRHDGRVRPLLQHLAERWDWT